MTRLAERFTTFVGIAAEGTAIESGIDRLRLPALASRGDVERLNRTSFERFEGLDGVATRWREAIEGATAGVVTPVVRSVRQPALRPFLLGRTLRYLVYEGAGAALLAFAQALRAPATGDLRAVGTVLAGAAIVAMVAVAPRLFRTLRLGVRHLPVDGSVRLIGVAVADALTTAGHVAPQGGRAPRVVTARAPGGAVEVHLDGVTFHEQSVFADALAEVLGPVANPRYLVTRRRNGVFGRRMDFHPVPSILAANKDGAAAFADAWHRHVSPGELVYTRREGGRRVLLAARARSFANQLLDPARRLDRWQ